MKLSVLTVCLNYADFLRYTLPNTSRLCDHVLVVTSVDDVETQAVCRRVGVEFLATDAFFQNRAMFNKGAAINEGLSALTREDWVLILDADILLRDENREFLDQAELDVRCIYGADRLDCPSYEAFERGEWETLQVMDRVAVAGTFTPLGYFQLFHTSAKPVGPWYETHYRYADRTDLTFAKSFDRRRYLPMQVVHLDGSHAGGANWRGRTSPKFGPT